MSVEPWEAGGALDPLGPSATPVPDVRPGYCETCDAHARELVARLRELLEGERLARPLDEPALLRALSELLHEHVPGTLS